jgi:integrase
MSSRKTKITKRTVDALQPGSVVWDTQVAGFGVRRQRRDRIYVLKARIGARQRWFTVGKHGTWTVHKARREARAILGEIDRGLDPATKRDIDAKTPTLDKVAERFLVQEIEAKRKPATAILYRDLWDRLAEPKLGLHKVSDVRFRDIADLHYGLRDTPVTANRLVAVLSSLFAWCERQGLRERNSNPATGIEKFKEKSRERFLSPRELARLGVALARAERKKTETSWVIGAIRLLMFTGMRRNEVLTLRREYLNLDKAMLVLPETKTGSRVVYLSAPALEVLASLPRVAKNPYVIVGNKSGGHLINLRKPWLRICKVARLRGVRLHDLRHSFASISVSGGASLPIVGKLLGHTKSVTTEKYSHLAADPLRAASEAVGQQIAAMLLGKKAEVHVIGKKASGKEAIGN